MFTIMREFSVLFLLITTLSSSETWIDVKKKKSRWHFKEFNNQMPHCTAWSVFHIILKLLAPSHVMAKLADTILGYSRCHNSSYLASDVKEDKVLLWTYMKLICIMALVHKEQGRKERPYFFQSNHNVILSEGVCQKKSKLPQIDRLC